MSKLPIFDPSKSFDDSAPTKRPARRVHTVRLGSKAVPVTEEELSGLQAALETHAQSTGVFYGFFAKLLKGAGLSVSA